MEQFKPSEFLKKALPVGFWRKKLLTNNFDLKKEQIRAIVTATALTQKELKATALKVIDLYEKKAQDLKREGVKAFKREATNSIGAHSLTQSLTSCSLQSYYSQ